MTTRRGFVAGLVLGGLGGAASMGIASQSEKNNTSGLWSDEADRDDLTTNGPPTPPDNLAAAIRSAVLKERDTVYGGTEPDLALDERLSEAAGYQARHMARKGAVVQEGPEGESLEQVYSKFGLIDDAENNSTIEYIRRGWGNVGSAEIDGSASDLAENIVNSWDEEVLTYRHWDAHGIGLAAKDGVVYAAQSFY